MYASSQFQLAANASGASRSRERFTPQLADPFVRQSAVSIRGRILKGLVLSTKMQRTIVLRRDYLHYIKKYKRYEKRHKNVSAHLSPCFSVKEGDIVTVGQCRPLSKTVRFNVIDVEACSLERVP